MKSDEPEFEPVETFCFTAHEDNISKTTTKAKIDFIIFTYIHPFGFEIKLFPAIVPMTGNIQINGKQVLN